ncbi:MAG: DUF4398 domain-containing protein [Deltaproteobacteria bacterium]|nr:DUF4398 domain-containing protein [Deltaproteobacteria bacterium]
MLQRTPLFLAILALGGCTAIQIPPDRLARNEASIRGAEEVGAMGDPAARLHLQLAKDQTVAAQRLAGNGDNRALLVLARAESDAELALAMAREASVHADALRAAEDLKALQERGAR